MASIHFYIRQDLHFILFKRPYFSYKSRLFLDANFTVNVVFEKFMQEQKMRE